MKLLRMSDLGTVQQGHIFSNVTEGAYIYLGGLDISLPGSRTHTNDGPGGTDFHVHDDCEIFLILQGQGSLELNKELYPIKTGDVIVVEPGEDHHLISDKQDPLVTLWCHTGKPEPHRESS